MEYHGRVDCQSSTDLYKQVGALLLRHGFQRMGSGDEIVCCLIQLWRANLHDRRFRLHAAPISLYHALTYIDLTMHARVSRCGAMLAVAPAAVLQEGI